MSVTIENILNLPVLQSAKIQAGHDGKNRIIEYVNIMDAPDIFDWVKQNELILTTAYVIKDDTEAQIRLIKQLAEMGCAGLGIKTKRYINSIPLPLIEQANACKLPLIELPFSKSLGDILNAILSHVLNINKVELEKAFEIHRRFTSLFIKGTDMTALAQTLGSIIHHPTAIVNTRLDVIGQSHDFHANVLGGKIRQKIIEQISKQNSEEHRLITLSHCPKDEPLHRYSIYPFYTTLVLRGYIVIEHKHDDSIPMMPLEQAANVISYEMIKQDALLEGERRLRANFFSELFNNVLTSRDEIVQRCERYGLKDEQLYWVAVGHLTQGKYSMQNGISKERFEQFRMLLEDQTEQFYQLSDISCTATTHGEYLVLIFSFSSFMNELEEKIINSLNSLRQSFNLNGNSMTCSFGLSNHVDQLTKLPQAYKEAVKALKYGYSSHNRDFTASYRTHEVSELIRLIPHQKLKEFYENTLKSLAYPDQDEKRELLRTLETYLRQNCLVTETARILFVHRNTVFYRLIKCQELLNVDLKDADTAMKLRLALAIHHVLHVS